MATSDMLRQAIADAKIIKETAIANAKNALEEAFTPKLKELLSEKIEEMDMEEEMEEGMHYEEETHEEKHHEEKEMHEGEKEMHEGEKEMHEGDMEEGEDMHEGEMSEEDLEEMLKEMEKEMHEGDMEEGEDMHEGDMEEGEDMHEEKEMHEGDMEEGEDMHEKEEMHEEEKAHEAKDEMHEEEKAHEGKDEMHEEEMHEEVSDEDLMDLIKDVVKSMADAGELEGVEVEFNDEEGEEEPEAEVEAEEETEELAEMRKENAELKEAVEFLTTQLNEINVLNAKLLYVNKIFKAKNLSESRKVKLLSQFDGASSIKEVKLVYNTVVANLAEETKVTKKSSLKEGVGRASKPSGVSSRKPIVNVDPTVSRFQKLAGIK